MRSLVEDTVPVGVVESDVFDVGIPIADNMLYIFDPLALVLGMCHPAGQISPLRLSFVDMEPLPALNVLKL